MSDYQITGTAVIRSRRRKVHHFFHFLMTLATAGLWGIVWITAILLA